MYKTAVVVKRCFLDTRVYLYLDLHFDLDILWYVCIVKYRHGCGVYVCRCFFELRVCKSVMYQNALYHLFAHPQISSEIRSYEPWI